jgi:imidazolonepropionase-like amidohydrolase
MRIRRNSLILLSLLCLAGAAVAETKVLRGFTLIDGTGRDPLPQAAMIVTDGKVQWIGPESRLKAPAGAEILKLDGKFVMPGIINLHGHLGNTVDLVQDPKNFTRANVEKNLKQYAAYGVTSMVSMGSDQPLIFEMRARQRAARPSETRIFTAGRGFTGVGGYPTTAMGMKGVPYEVATAEDVDKDVKELAEQKVDLIKMWVDDHLGKEKKIPLDLAKRIVEDAHKYHIKAAAHVFYLSDATALSDAGLDELAHSVRDTEVDESLIAAMKKHGTYQTATLTREASLFAFAKPSPMLNDPFFQRSVSANVLRTLKSPEYQKKVSSDPDFAEYPHFLEMAQKNLKKLFDAGVNVGFGTDTGPPGRFAGFFEHWELELMVQAGLTPIQAITCATRNSAQFLGANDLGTLEAGKWADLVVLSRNPLTDITNSRSIEAVMIAGNKIP